MTSSINLSKRFRTDENSVVSTKIMINLNTCVPGQKLKTKHGTILTYVKKYRGEAKFPHQIEYSNGSFGTRTNDGFTYSNPEKRLETDEDVAEILPL